MWESVYYYRKKEKRQQHYKQDVLIYGATPAGITAAITLKKNGHSVRIAECSRFIGGMTTSGLGATDLGAEQALGGLAKQFYDEIAQHYGMEKCVRFEPHVAERIFKTWLQEQEINVQTEQFIESAVLENQSIQQVRMTDGATYEAKQFIDASYEGDLLAHAGVEYIVGREASTVYKEIYNGVQFGTQHHKFESFIDPYIEEGNPASGLLSGISEEYVTEHNGAGDHRIQAYNFRMCLTKEEKVPFPKPHGYERDYYALLLRYIKAGHWDAMKLHTPLMNGKTDLNNHGAFSTDFIGMNYAFPDADYESREEIYQQHVTYVAGLLYFLANDEEVPSVIQEEVRQWGLAADEFTDTDNWPRQLYIREARRMIGEYVMTEHHALQREICEQPIAVASFHMDSHNCRRVVVNGRVMNEGDIQVPVKPFMIDLRALLPKKEHCTNLIVPVCLSASHIAYGSIRMEPIFMMLGQVAGAATASAIVESKAVQDISYEQLKQQLIEQGHVVEWDESYVDDPLRRMEETFGGK
ncbi:MULTISPECIES: FAD-dependent oxidoreductase [Solibacillus]|uniref:FAD-dependent oxidoreductase n=1 Tax=Solibacillus merdavium TaxID=2762218 RepID=A0ABR8XR50_9BACL|nr:FAD-dependent oxidoreductase [Solibacillus merdavium]MBD8034423.1 FAD-dependent oxidoreductase [Solibacillus merdavium]